MTPTSRLLSPEQDITLTMMMERLTEIALQTSWRSRSIFHNIASVQNETWRESKRLQASETRSLVHTLIKVAEIGSGITIPQEGVAGWGLAGLYAVKYVLPLASQGYENHKRASQIEEGSRSEIAQLSEKDAKDHKGQADATFSEFLRTIKDIHDASRATIAAMHHRSA